MNKNTKDSAEFALGPALEFLQGIWEFNHALERTSLNMERRLGVTAQQRLLVRCLGKYPGMTASQLASVLHLDPATLSVTVRRLTEKGLLTGKRDATDRRRVALRLTEAGKRLTRYDGRTVEAAVDRLLERLDAGEVATVRRVLSMLSVDLTALASLDD